MEMFQTGNNIKWSMLSYVQMEAYVYRWGKLTEEFGFSK